MQTSRVLVWVTFIRFFTFTEARGPFAARVSIERLLLSPISLQARVTTVKWEKNNGPMAKEICISVLRVFKRTEKRVPESFCFKYSQKILLQNSPVGATFLLHFKVNKRGEQVLLGEPALARNSSIRQVEKITASCSEKRAERHPSRCGPVRIDNSTFLNKIRVKEGDAVVLRCDAVGKPPFEWRWLLPVSVFLRRPKNGKLKHIRRGSRGRLIITSAKKAFQGKYRCTVYNAHGKASSSVRLRVDRNDLHCDGNLKIRPTESKLLRSPYFYTQGGEKLKRKCIWKICPSKGWHVMTNMMTVHTAFSSNQFATWWNMGKKQKPTVSIEMFLPDCTRQLPLNKEDLQRNISSSMLTLINCGRGRRPSCGSISDGMVTSDCRSGCVKIVYRPRYARRAMSILRLNVWVGTTNRELPQIRTLNYSVYNESSTNNPELRNLYCESDFVVKARVRSVQGNKRTLCANVIEVYKSGTLTPKRRMYFAISSSIAGHPIFDCMARYKSVNYLIGRMKADGAFEVIRVISNKTLSSKLVHQLETYKKNSAICSLRN